MSRFKSVSTLVVLLGFFGWAEPVRAQALDLPLGSNLFSSIGVFTQQLQATGGTPPYTYSFTPLAAVPPGARIQNGQPLPTNFPGTVTAGLLAVFTQAGTYPTSIRVTDHVGATFDRATTINVLPTAISTNPPKATLSQPYSFTMTAFGGSGYTWAATGLPPGLGISTTGVVSGTPTASGSFTASIQITSVSPSNTRFINVVFTVDPYAIETPGLLPPATSGVFYTQTLSAPGCGSPCSWTPTFFAGLSLNSSGVLSGTPFLQTGSFAVTVTGTNGPVTKQFSLFVSNNSTTLTSGFGGFGDQTVGNYITAQILPFGGAPPYTASLVSGTLPTGLSLVGPGETVCSNCSPSLPYLAGRAMQVGSYTFTLKFMDSAGSSYTPPPYTWNISPISNSYFNLPLTGSMLAVGTPYTQPLLVTGGNNNYTFQAFSALPGGLAIDTNTGVISGTPTTGGNLTSQIRISDSGVLQFTAFIQFNVTGPPTVVTLPATSVFNTGAALNGTVNPAGFTTTGNFQWGTTTAYGNTTPTVSFGSSLFNQNALSFISINCVAGSVYHYRLVATNSQGTSLGNDQAFTCSPVLDTFDADQITSVSARLNGDVNANGLASTAFFQWGTTTAYGNSTSSQTVGSGTFFVPIPSVVLSGLTCGTLYHFRAVANNINGASFGSDRTFMTNPCSPIAYTGVAIRIGRTDTTLFGAVVPDGTATNAHFEWGTTTAYGNSTAAQSMGSGQNELAMTPTAISGLTCNTTYHFRAVASNSFGTSNGSDQAFTTAQCTAATFRGFTYTLNGYPFTNLVYGYGVTSSGALQQLTGFPVPTGGQGTFTSSINDASDQLAYDAVNHRLYAINMVSSTLSVFSVSPLTGALTAMPFSPIALPPGFLGAAVRVHPSGSPVVVAGIDNGSGSTGFVASYVVTDTTATPAAGSPYAPGVPTFSAAFSRDGKYLYAGGGDGINNDPSTAGFSVSAATGVLTPLAGSPFALGGVYPIGYATDASGRLFATNPNNQLRVFTTPNGVPTAVAGNPFAAGGLGNIQTGVLHPAGFYIAVEKGGTGGGKVSVSQISGSGAGTTTANVAGSPFGTGGFTSTTLALSTDGRYLFVPNQDTHNLTVFGVNGSTGALTRLSVQPEGTLGNFGYLSGVAFVGSGSTVDDVDGDGKTDVAIFRPSTGTWWTLLSSTNTYTAQPWGVASDIPVPGDYDGDGKTDVAIFRPSTGTWWILQSSTNTYVALPWGVASDIPVPGDYDGDGKTDLAIFRPSTGTWWILQSSTNTYVALPWGVASDIPVPGDYDGDGKTDVAIFRPSTGTWWVLQSSTNTYTAQPWGVASDIPVPGDYDGDGKTDVAIFRPSTGTWWVLQSSTNTYTAQPWGIGSDIPLNHRP